MTSPGRRDRVTSPAADDVTGQQSRSRDVHESSATAAVSVGSSSVTESSVSSSNRTSHAASSTSTDDVTPNVPSSAIPGVDLSTSSGGEYLARVRWLNDVLVVLCLVVFVVIIVAVLVCLLRARSRHQLCWTKHRCYLPVPLFYQNGTRGAAVIADPSLPGTTRTTLGNGSTPAKGPELAPLTYV